MLSYMIATQHPSMTAHINDSIPNLKDREVPSLMTQLSRVQIVRPTLRANT
jgi:hypothetical protein